MTRSTQVRENTRILVNARKLVQIGEKSKLEARGAFNGELVRAITPPFFVTGKKPELGKVRTFLRERFTIAGVAKDIEVFPAVLRGKKGHLVIQKAKTTYAKYRSLFDHYKNSEKRHAINNLSESSKTSEPIGEPLESWATNAYFPHAISTINFVTDHNGAYVLLGIQSSNSDGYGQGKVKLPGGLIEPGDKTIKDGAKRENLEETDLNVKDGHLLPTLVYYPGAPNLSACFHFKTSAKLPLKITEETGGRRKQFFWVPIKHVKQYLKGDKTSFETIVKEKTGVERVEIGPDFLEALKHFIPRI